jgi:hypothetical protein
MSNQIQNPNVKMFSDLKAFTGSGLFSLRRGVAFFILLDTVDEPMNGSSYAQCATPRYLKTVQFSSVNLEP